MNKRLFTLAATSAVLLSTPLLAACGGGADSKASSGGGVAVTATDDSCHVANTTLKPGKTTFTVTNKGQKTTEVYVYGEQAGKYSKIIAEVENVGPGITRDLTVDLTGGTYEIACKPGQTGDGIRTKVTVEGAKAATSSAAAKYDREIEIEATDTALARADGLTAKTGERIEFKLENKGTKKRILEVIDPAGTVVTEFEVEPGKTGEAVVALSTAGTWKLKVEGGDKEFEAPLTVA